MVKVSFELTPESSAPATVASVPATSSSAAAATSTVPPPLRARPTIAGSNPPGFEGKQIRRINIFGLSDQARSDLMSRLPLHVGDTLAADSIHRLGVAVREFDQHLNFGFGTDSDGGVEVIIHASASGVPGGVIGGVPGGVIGGVKGGVVGGVVGGIPSVPPPSDGTKRITIGGNVQQAKLISQPKPVYPPDAKLAHVSGIVHLSAVIGKEGNVINLAVISGHPLLVPSAVEAVRQWVYQTTLLNGEPVEVVTQIDVNYTLSDNPPVQQ
jgi:hypothetical protein